MYRFVFGPVLSGRLGRSLGLDLLGSKVCSMDCVYCEVGPTRVRTRERKTWVPPRELLDELAAWKAEGFEAPDVVTLGGSGEPTLNSGLAEILAGCRTILPGVPVAVLTNSTLLDDASVRRELCAADMVLPSLDSLVEEEFAAVNRPLRGITAAGCAQGIRDLRREFSGRLFLEVLLCRGWNDSAANLADGPAEAALPRQVQALDEARLRGALAATLARRPQTVLHLAAALGADSAQVQRMLARMARDGEIFEAESDGQMFYSATRRL